jgi:predicted nuclease of predicted toxin-antitoxin system
VVWEHAKSHGFAIVTADADFYNLANAFGPPPKVVWIPECDFPTDVTERLIRSQAIRIVRFLEDDEQAVLILAR